MRRYQCCWHAPMRAIRSCNSATISGNQKLLLWMRNTFKRLRDNLPQGHLGPLTFYPKDILPHWHFAPRTFCPRTFCPNFCKNSGHFAPIFLHISLAYLGLTMVGPKCFYQIHLTIVIFGRGGVDQLHTSPLLPSFTAVVGMVLPPVIILDSHFGARWCCQCGADL